jgi:hypothetical protein
MSNYYLCIFCRIIYNKKLDGRVKTDNDVYILHIKKYIIRTYSSIER